MTKNQSKIVCTCGSSVKKNYLSKHLETTIHAKKLYKKTLKDILMGRVPIPSRLPELGCSPALVKSF